MSYYWDNPQGNILTLWGNLKVAISKYNVIPEATKKCFDDPDTPELQEILKQWDNSSNPVSRKTSSEEDIPDSPQATPKRLLQ